MIWQIEGPVGQGPHVGNTGHCLVVFVAPIHNKEVAARGPPGRSGAAEGGRLTAGGRVGRAGYTMYSNAHGGG